MNIHNRAEEVITHFNKFKDWEDRYRELIGWGKKLEGLPEEQKIEENKVKGCQSQVWLVPSLEDGMIIFKADSDAAIVKGIIALLVHIYSNSKPQEILHFKPDFIDQIELRQHLSMSRANGLNSMLKKLTLYAMAYQAKLQMK